MALTFARPLGQPLTGSEAEAPHALDLVNRPPATLEEWNERFPNGIEIKVPPPTWASGPRPTWTFNGLRPHINRTVEQAGIDGKYHAEQIERSFWAKRVIDCISAASRSSDPAVHKVQLELAVKHWRSMQVGLESIGAAIIEAAEHLNIEVSFLPPVAQND